MPAFKNFAAQVTTHFELLTTKHQTLFVTATDKSLIYDTYINSFPLDSNPIYIERTEHDCNICSQFIKRIGNLVAINPNGSLVSIWDIPNLPEPYATVADTLAVYVKSQPVSGIFLHNEPTVGRPLTHQQTPTGVIDWNHFHADIPDRLFEKDIATKRGIAVSQQAVHLRSLTELSQSAIQTVIDLINENSLYRGSEFLDRVLAFQAMQLAGGLSASLANYAWLTYREPGAGIRNTAIGTLLVDLSGAVEFSEAIRKYNKIMDPNNYKRMKTDPTKRMLEQAIVEIDKQGIRDSLLRRPAVSSDISVNDILFTNRRTSLADSDPLMDLLPQQSSAISGLDSAPTITMEDFLTNVLPTTSELFIAQSPALSAHEVHISAPTVVDSPNILQWGNNFSWSYAGNVADSDISRNVAAKGGKLDGILRFSLQWNERGRDRTDLDIHCAESTGTHIYHGNRHSTTTGGTLDIDIVDPDGVAVENIVWPNLVDGYYRLYIRDYPGNGLRDNFTCEVVFNNTTYSYEYTGNMASRDVDVATVTYKSGVISIEHHLPCQQSYQPTELVPVTLAMLSPNFWESGNQSGNKHYFFLTDSVTATAPFRGYYNEFLHSSLHTIRKSMDMLASKMMCEPSPEGLSGYGFSTTKPTSIYLKADNRLYEVTI